MKAARGPGSLERLRPTMRSALLLALATLALAACGRSDVGGFAPGLDDVPPAPDTPPAWAAEAVWVAFDLRAEAAADSLAPDFEADSLAADTAGALQRALDALPDVEALGATAISLGDLADPRAPHHVDPALGPDPAGDRERMGLEEADDPETWATTAADRLLQDLVEAAHDRGLRVVADGPWAAAGDETAALAAAVRWLDPDGDGDPSDGLDGFRVRGVEARPAAFWGTLRRVVKAVRPEALLVAALEPTAGGATADPAPWLGPPFDAAVDDRPGRALAPFLDPTGPRRSAADLAAELGALYASVPPDHLPALWMAPAESGLDAARDGASTPDSARSVRTPRPLAPVEADRLGRLLQAVLPGAPLAESGLEADPFAARAFALRRAHPDLFARGTLEWMPDGDVLRLVRRVEGEGVLVVVNRAAVPWRVEEPVDEVLLATGPAPVRTASAVWLAPGAGAVFRLEAPPPA